MTIKYLVVDIILGFIGIFQPITFHDIIICMKKLKTSKVYLVESKRSNIKLFRGIILLVLLIGVIYWGHGKLRLDNMLCIVFIILQQVVVDIYFGLKRQTITENGIVTNYGFIDFVWIQGVVWEQVGNDINNTFKLEIEIRYRRRKSKKHEFIVLIIQKEFIDEFLNSKLQWLYRE